jgi:signal transduction histidine kinase
VVANAIFYLLITDDATEHHRWELVLLGAMVVWYLVLGRRVVADHRESWRGWLFHAVLLALFVGALALDESAVSLLLFALCPLAYLTVRFRRAHAVVGAYAFSPAAVGAAIEGPRVLPILVMIGVVSTTVSVVIGETTARVEIRSDERAALIRELEASRAEVARLSHEAGIAAERQRLAGEIHDTVAQGLSSVVMLVEAADAALDRDPTATRDHLRLAARTARDNLDETRAIVAALTPAALVTAPLADALRRLVDGFAATTGTAATLATLGEQRRLPTGTEVVLLRVVQEALNNVRKHAGATTVSVELETSQGTATVRVRDDGVGFDSSVAEQGYGLGGMRARVAQIGGTLTITTSPGEGTTIVTEVPA